MRTLTRKRRTHPRLASARAYWRLARKEEIAGNYGQAERYRRQGEHCYQQYLKTKKKK